MQAIFFWQCAQCFTYPSPLHIYFPTPSQFYYFPIPQFFYSLLHNFIMFSSPSPLLLFYIFFHSQKNRPHIDHTSTLDSTLFQHSFVNSKTMYNHHYISIVFSPPPPPHLYCFPLPHLYCFPPPPPAPPHFYCFYSSWGWLFLACVWPVSF